jgi:hypothetical protein
MFEFLIDWLSFPCSSTWVRKVDNLASSTLLCWKYLNINFRSPCEGWFKSETKMLNCQNTSFYIIFFHWSSLIAVLSYWLIFRSKVDILNLIGCFPGIVFQKCYVDSPLKLRSGGGYSTIGKFSEWTLSYLLTIMCRGVDGEYEKD